MEKLVQKTSLLLTTFLTLMVGLPLAASAADHPPVITWYQTQDDPAPTGTSSDADAGFIRVETDKPAGNLRRIYLLAKLPIPISENANTSIDHRTLLFESN